MVSPHVGLSYSVNMSVGRLTGCGWHTHKKGGMYVVGFIGDLKFSAIGKQAEFCMSHHSAFFVVMTGKLVKDKEGHCLRCSYVEMLDVGANTLKIVSMDDAPRKKPLCNVGSGDEEVGA
jgi:hypothetical protein